MSTTDSYNHIRHLAQLMTERELEFAKQVCCYLGQEDRIEEVQNHFVYKDTKKNLKAMKDENAPKKARSSYLLFSNSIRDEVRKENPKLDMGQVSKILGARWNSASDEVKEEFKLLAEKDKERYRVEHEAYTKKLHEQNGSLNGVGSSNSSTN